MRADELDQHPTERKRYMGHQTILVATEIKNYAIVSNEIDGVTELAFYVGRILPMRLGCNSKPCADRTFRMRMARPEFLQRTPGDHLHVENISRHQFGDNAGKLHKLLSQHVGTYACEPVPTSAAIL